MSSVNDRIALAIKVEDEIRHHILPYWVVNSSDNVNGGFIGRMDYAGKIDFRADKAIILNTRILWTFSAAYRIYGDAQYLQLAQKAYQYLKNYFMDEADGGVFWSVKYDGKPSETTKYLYGQAFSLFAISEFALIDSESKGYDCALDLYNLIENKCYKKEYNGYQEVFNRDWSALKGVPLGDDTETSRHSLNTHLHLLEAYANLYRMQPRMDLAERLKNLIELHIEIMYDPEIRHFYNFFNRYWEIKARNYSYGHDIEAVWLLLDAARLIKDSDLILKMEKIAMEVAESLIYEGLDKNHGGIFNLGNNGKVLDSNKQWWAQAEAIVGLNYVWELDKNNCYMGAAKKIWEFIEQNFKDKIHGEWFFLVSKEGKPNQEYDKIGPWKCPYHTVRMAIELQNLIKTTIK